MLRVNVVVVVGVVILCWLLVMWSLWLKVVEFAVIIVGVVLGMLPMVVTAGSWWGLYDGDGSPLGCRRTYVRGFGGHCGGCGRLGRHH